METMELDARILAKAKSMKISSIEVTDFERNIRDFTNVSELLLFYVTLYALWYTYTTVAFNRIDFI